MPAVQGLRPRHLRPRCASTSATAIPETIIEPGRGYGRQRRRDRGGGGADLQEVGRGCKVRWVYLDIGKFGGLAETMDEMIRYPIRTAFDGDDDQGALRDRRADLRLGLDVLYEKVPYPPSL